MKTWVQWITVTINKCLWKLSSSFAYMLCQLSVMHCIKGLNKKKAFVLLFWTGQAVVTRPRSNQILSWPIHPHKMTWLRSQSSPVSEQIDLQLNFRLTPASMASINLQALCRSPSHKIMISECIMFKFLTKGILFLCQNGFSLCTLMFSMLID